MRADYKGWLERQKYSEHAMSSRQSELRRLEEAYGDLDDHYEKDRMESLIASLSYSGEDKRRGKANPANFQINGDVYNSLATYRAALRLYQEFRDSIGNNEKSLEPRVGEEIDAIVEELESTQRLGLERDMQVALRSAIEQLEAGLSIIDGGVERSVDSGRIDITARDASGALVVIELKAGIASRSAVGQILSYMGDVSNEEAALSVRGILVASDFDKKTKSAARLVPNLVLRRYNVKFQFSDVSDN